MKQLLYPILIVLGISLIVIHPVVVLIIIATLVVLTLAFLLFLIKGFDKREKEVSDYLDECDEKLKKGEMTKEDNELVHCYWEDSFIC